MEKLGKSTYSLHLPYCTMYTRNIYSSTVPSVRRYLGQPICAALLLIFLIYAWYHAYTHYDYDQIPATAARPSLRETHGQTPSNTHDAYNATLGFEKIMVLSLPSRTDRRDSMVLAAALNDLEVEFIDGVDGASVPDKAIPLRKGAGRIKEKEVGCWRAHMNALQEVVRRNLSSALIMEDDADWDVRIHDQLHDFARSTRALLSKDAQQNQTSTTMYVGEEVDSLISKESNPSPYGEDWDLFWLGHCIMQFGEDSQEAPRPSRARRVVHLQDEKVPQRQFIRSIIPNDDIVKQLREQYPDHTRVVHHAQSGLCLAAYAVSQRGARRMLSELALRPVGAPVDFLFRDFCDRRTHTCLTAQPPYFNPYKFAGNENANSDITDNQNEPWPEKAVAYNVRWSVRMNADAIMAGELLGDQWPDT